MDLNGYRIKGPIGIVFLLLLFALPNSLRAQGDNIRFRHLSVEEGLSQSFARSIVQDDNGFIWIGTEAGINKYDGYSFRVYETDPENLSSPF